MPGNNSKERIRWSLVGRGSTELDSKAWRPLVIGDGAAKITWKTKTLDEKS
jgi:hypothetical protein